MASIDSKWARLLPIIEEICRISGIPGVSVGILENCQVSWTASLGYANIASQRLCDSDTIFPIGSLTMTITAALVASLIEDGLIPSWNTPVKTLLPNFIRQDIYDEITLADLLSHRTGLASLEAYFPACNKDPCQAATEAIEILSHAPAIQPLRTEFSYNGFAYEIIGEIIESASGRFFEKTLQKRILNVLGMKQTHYKEVSHGNVAKFYAALADGSTVPIRSPFIQWGRLNGPAGGVWSSVNDLLILYKAFLSAANKEWSSGGATESAEKCSRFIPRIYQLWKGHQSMPFNSLRENSYGYGLARAQLPAVLSLANDPNSPDPMVGAGAPSQLALYHGGTPQGFESYAVLLPETSSAVVVLTNSQSLNGGARWIGELLTETLLNNSHNAPDYREIATKAAQNALRRVESINAAIRHTRAIPVTSKALSFYVGRYHNAGRTFAISITHKDKSRPLEVTLIGRSNDRFSLYPYQDDSFYFKMTHDEYARLGRGCFPYMGYFIIRFEMADNGKGISCLWWQHQSDISYPGEMFEKDQFCT